MSSERRLEGREEEYWNVGAKRRSRGRRDWNAGMFITPRRDETGVPFQGACHASGVISLGLG